MDEGKGYTFREEGGWSRDLLFQLVGNVKDYAIFVSDPTNKIVSWSVGAERIFGFSADEAIGQDASIIFTAEDRANRMHEKEIEQALKEGRAEDERSHMRKDGSRFFASGVMTPLYDEAGALTGFAKIVRDLTERVVAQEQLREAYDSVEATVQLRTEELSRSNAALRREIAGHKKSERLRAALLRKIVRTQEDERKRIAREIHDNIGQQLTGLKLQIQLLLDRHQDDPEMAEDISLLGEIADQIDAEVDFLVWELRPLVLEEFGLIRALEKYVRDWSAHFNIPAEFYNNGVEANQLLPEIEINIYRIVQEALNNIGKHARASRASVMLEHRDSEIVLVIEDDGVGFEPERTPDSVDGARGLGLLGMKERAELVGGSMDIESGDGKGTTIFVRIPANVEAPERPGSFSQ